jgi:hypothetical protein
VKWAKIERPSCMQESLSKAMKKPNRQKENSFCYGNQTVISFSITSLPL